MFFIDEQFSSHQHFRIHPPSGLYISKKKTIVLKSLYSHTFWCYSNYHCNTSIYPNVMVIYLDTLPILPICLNLKSISNFSVPASQRHHCPLHNQTAKCHFWFTPHLILPHSFLTSSILINPVYPISLNKPLNNSPFSLITILLGM